MGHHGRLKATAQGTATHQKRIYLPDIVLVPEDQHSYQTELPELVLDSKRKHRAVLAADEPLDLPLGIAPRGQVELVGPLRELRDPRNLIRLGTVDACHRFERSQVILYRAELAARALGLRLALIEFGAFLILVRQTQSVEKSVLQNERRISVELLRDLQDGYLRKHLPDQSAFH